MVCMKHLHGINWLLSRAGRSRMSMSVVAEILLQYRTATLTSRIAISTPLLLTAP